MTKKRKKFSVQVRRYPPGQNHHYTNEFTLVKTIFVALYAEAIGNFNPIFCRYNGNPRVLVHSDDGDLSDPFRREQSYEKTLFIETYA